MGSWECVLGDSSFYLSTILCEFVFGKFSFSIHGDLIEVHSFKYSHVRLSDPSFYPQPLPRPISSCLLSISIGMIDGKSD